jgi:hypothetical protein
MHFMALRDEQPFPLSFGAKRTIDGAPMPDKSVEIIGHCCGAGSRTCGFDPLWISNGVVRGYLNGVGRDRVSAGLTEALGHAVLSYGWEQLKLAASSKFPAPEYFATCG